MPFMGWTHDYRDVSRNRRRSMNEAASMSSISDTKDQVMMEGNRLATPLGIPRIIGRRARWMTARLRHARSD